MTSKMHYMHNMQKHCNILHIYNHKYQTEIIINKDKHNKIMASILNTQAIMAII